MFDVRCSIFLFTTGLVLMLIFDVRSQTNPPAPSNPPPQINPLMQLMVSQPAVEVSSTVTASAVLDPPLADVGDKIVYRIHLNALDTSVRCPQEILMPAGLKLTLYARGQTFQQTGRSLRPLTALNYHTRVERRGFYSISGLELEVNGKPVRVPDAHLEVWDDVEANRKRARELLLVPARTNVFVGESVKLRVLLPSSTSNIVETLAQLQFNGAGILSDKNSVLQKVEPIEFNGRNVAAWTVEAEVTPFVPGPRTITAQAFAAGMHFTGPVTLSDQAAFLARPQQPMLLDSEPMTLQVRPLPPPGTIKGYNGFIGSVTLEPPVLGTNFLRVGDAVRLLVTFQSPGPLTRLVPPPTPQVTNWQVLPPIPAETPPTASPRSNPAATFAYTLIPLTEEARHTPAIPFSVFEPSSAAYLDLTIPPIKVSVMADGLPTDWKPATSLAGSGREPKLSLSDLTGSPGKRLRSLVPPQMRSWFVPVQLLPALALAGIWAWDRRRRFLEAHPDILRRRQARRALRREKRALQRAAANGDALAFARRAVNALQIAAAPHFPAEPRALVCGEVLSVFDHGDRSGKTGEVIRSFFESDAHTSFAPKPDSPRSLFALRPDLETILGKMEARLQ